MSSAEPPEKALLVLAVVLHLPLLLSATWDTRGRSNTVRADSSSSQIVRESGVRYSRAPAPERENGLKRPLPAAMLNDILAVCVAAAVVVVIATILGAVETVRKVVATICNR